MVHFTQMLTEPGSESCYGYMKPNQSELALNESLHSQMT